MNLKNNLLFYLNNEKKNVVTERYKSIFTINWDKILKKVDLIIFDIDDTITNHNNPLSPKSIELLYELKSAHKKIVLLSNSKNKRLKFIQKNIKRDFTIIIDAKKPNKEIIHMIYKSYGVSPQKSIIIGDRAGTDLFSGFLGKTKFRFLVEPYSNVFNGKKPSIIYRSIRLLENSLTKNRL